MKKKSKVLALVLSVLMFAMTVNYSVLAFDEADASAEATENDNVLNKIHFYLDVEDNYTIDSLSELNEATASLETNGISTFSATGGEPTENEINVTVEFSSNFMETEAYQAFLEERDTLDDIEEVHEWRARLNAYSKEFHQNLVNKSLAALADFEYSEYDVIGYSPFVVLKTDIADVSASSLVNLAECDNVENISLSYGIEVVADSSWDECLDVTNAYSVVNNRTYTGQGCYVGIYEFGGVCDVSHTNLSDKRIIVRDSYSTTSEHATRVTSIVAEIAPNAQFFVSPIEENDIGIEWFIEQNCDIINCSFGYYANINNGDGTFSEGIRGYRADFDAIYDYQIKVHLVTVVVSSGNYVTDNTSASYNPSNKIVSPGYAYNAITVGGTSQLYRLGEEQWCASINASYICPDDQMKPNVVAPFAVEIPNIGRYLGTSYAAPIVTGCIALLWESDAKYITYPDLVLSTITATAQKTYDYSNDNGEFDIQVGAGIINLEGMLDTDNYICIDNDNANADVHIINRNVTLEAGEEIQIGLSWLIDVEAPVDGASQDIHVTNYDLYLYDSYGAIIASSTLTDSNTELIRTTISSSGIYTIAVYQKSSKNVNNTADEISLVYDLK